MQEENELTTGEQAETQLELGSLDPVAESAPASETEHEEKPVNRVQERIDKITAQKYEEKALREAAEKELQELRQKLAQTEKKPAEVPEMPDDDLKYSDPEGYKAQMAEYQRSLAASIVDERLNESREAERLKLEQEQQVAKMRQTQEHIASTAANAGLTFEEVDSSAGVLAQRGLNEQNPQAVEILFNHENSAALIDHLAKNPDVYEEVSGIRDSISLIRKLDSLQSDALSRKVSDAPAPTETLKGAGVREPDDFQKAFPGAEIL